MKIAHIAPPWLAIPPQHYGGTETVIFNLVEEQVAQGNEVTLLAPGNAKTSARLVSFFDRSLIDSGVPRPAHLKAFYHLHEAVEYVRQHEFDILHTHLSAAAGMYLFPLTAQLSTPHLMTIHSRFPFDRVGSWTGDADTYYLLKWGARAPLNPLQWEEPFGMVMIEAMALGCPVIAFPRGSAPEIVAHGQSGFLARDVDEMVDYMRQIDQLDRSSVRAYAEVHFSARVMAERYLALYHKVIASRQLRSYHSLIGVAPRCLSVEEPELARA